MSDTPKTTQQLVDEFREYNAAKRICAGYEGGDHARMVAEVQDAHTEIARLRLELERLHGDAMRALGVLGLLIAESTDPGAEALAAQACLIQTLVNTRRSAS